MTVLILARNLPLAMPLQSTADRRPFGLGELNLVNDTRGHHRLGDAPTSHAIDACAHGYLG